MVSASSIKFILFFFFNDTATTEIYTLSLHDALPICAALAAYFRCLADGAPAEDFAREVDHAITDFADHEWPRHLSAARRVANAEQKAALRRLPKSEGRR